MIYSLEKNVGHDLHTHNKHTIGQDLQNRKHTVGYDVHTQENTAGHDLHIKKTRLWTGSKHPQYTLFGMIYILTNNDIYTYKLTAGQDLHTQKQNAGHDLHNH